MIWIILVLLITVCAISGNKSGICDRCGRHSSKLYKWSHGDICESCDKDLLD